MPKIAWNNFSKTLNINTIIREKEYMYESSN